MRQSYLDYAMSVIVSRALPDVREHFIDERGAPAHEALDGRVALEATAQVGVALFERTPEACDRLPIGGLYRPVQQRFWQPGIVGLIVGDVLASARLCRVEAHHVRVRRWLPGSARRNRRR